MFFFSHYTIVSKLFIRVLPQRLNRHMAGAGKEGCVLIAMVQLCPIDLIGPNPRDARRSHTLVTYSLLLM